MDIKFFKTIQYVCLKPDKMPDEVWGYLCKGYTIENDEIFLISGTSNIKHHINDLKENYKTYIMNLINKNK